MQLLTGRKSKQHIAEVIENILLSENIYRMTIYSPEIAKNSQPGQFVSILCDDLVLRRPFSIANSNNEIITLIYALKGEGTNYIGDLKNGDKIDILGPLGKGFNITNQRALLLAGGVGIAPMIYLSNIMKNKQIPHYFLSGFRKNINIPELNVPNSKIITDDGSSGNQGVVNNYLDKIIEEYDIEKIYTCGPTPVMKYAVDSAQKYNIDIEVAMEKKFACGVGVCMGCSVQLTQENKIINKRICKDGPVFNGKVIVW